jgi:hypothetical protein
LAVAATIEPVTQLPTERGVQRRDPAQVRERSLAAKPLGVVTGGDQQRGSDVGPDTLFGEQLRSGCGHQGVQLAGELDRLGVELPVAAGEQPQRLLGRLGRGVELEAGT